MCKKIFKRHRWQKKEAFLESLRKHITAPRYLTYIYVFIPATRTC